MDKKQLDVLSINTLKINGVAAVNKANSGHPGIVLGAATMLHTLYTRHMIYDPKMPDFINRDRFILSAGHGSALQYAMLRILGQIEQKDLEDFRQLGSITPGHPEYGMTPGIEITTGPLGQGLAMGVGIALGESHLRGKFPEVKHNTYVIIGDGDLQEGVASEAMSLAGKLELENLIVLHDSNDVQLDTDVEKVMIDNMKQKIESMNWHYQIVHENDVDAIDQAISVAKTTNKPSFIEIKTIIGDGATAQGTSSVHGSPLGADFENVKKKLNWTTDDFFLPDEVSELYRDTVIKRGKEAVDKFVASKELTSFLKDASITVDINIKPNQATRASSGEVIQHLNDKVEQFIGGSADLTGSTKAIGGDGVFGKDNRKGRHILFGVREFAMAAIGNGLALHSNFKPFVSTFFVFSDYLKPALRLSALMHLPVIYVMTHDSVFVGEDGPTHEPIEQLAMLRSIPNTVVIRPADEKEVIGAWEYAINSKDKPVVLVLTRQNLTSLDVLKASSVKEGYYQIHKGKKDFNIIASGSEVANAYELGKEFDVNVFSIPSSNLIKDYKLDSNKTISIEAATTFGWGRYAKYNFGIDTFGHSGDGNAVYKEVGLDIDTLREKFKTIIK